MKLTCAILLFCVVLYSEAGRGNHEGHEKFREAKEKCAGDMGLDINTIKQFFKNPEQDTSDENVKCFFRCFMQQMGSMDTDGNIVDPPNHANAPQGMTQAFNECRSVTGENACDKAWNFHKCFVPKKHAAHQQH